MEVSSVICCLSAPKTVKYKTRRQICLLVLSMGALARKIPRFYQG